MLEVRKEDARERPDEVGEDGDRRPDRHDDRPEPERLRVLDE